jgi:hypothetical protein
LIGVIMLGELPNHPGPLRCGSIASQKFLNQ